MSDKVYVNDIGTDIVVDCEEDISTGTNLIIKYK